MSLTIAAIGGVVLAMAKYLAASKAAETIGGKALEEIGKSGGEAVTTVGKSAFARLKALLSRGDGTAAKAKQALDNVETDPADVDYQTKLAKELEQLAQTDTELRTALEELSRQLPPQMGRADVKINIGDEAKVTGQVIGVVGPGGSVTATFHESEDKES